MSLSSFYKRSLEVNQKIRQHGFAWAAKRLFTKATDIGQIRTRLNKKKDGRNFQLIREATSSTLLDVLTAKSNKPFKVQSVFIENSTYCNLRCPGCFLTTQIESGDWKYQHMSISDFKLVICNLPHAETLSLHSYGEPTIHPDFPEMVKFAKETGKFSHITTTTNLTVRKETYYDKLFDCGLDHLTISVDSFDPAIVEKLRPRTDIDKLRSNLEHVISGHASHIHIATVASKVNLYDLGNTYEIINQMAMNGDSQVYISLMKLDPTLFDDLSDMYDDCLTPGEHHILHQFIEDWKVAFPKLKFGPSTEEKEAGGIPTSLCLRTWNSIRVSVQGYIDTCIYHREPFLSPEFSDLTKHSFEEIMSSQPQVDYLSSFLKKSPDFCEDCRFNYQR
jgi:MoaA/NifB/PqqE/SkfB family radical SAM enzyme